MYTLNRLEIDDTAMQNTINYISAHKNDAKLEEARNSQY